jgi:hypothetical protein
MSLHVILSKLFLFLVVIAIANFWVGLNQAKAEDQDFPKIAAEFVKNLQPPHQNDQILKKIIEYGLLEYSKNSNKPKHILDFTGKVITNKNMAGIEFDVLQKNAPKFASNLVKYLDDGANSNLVAFNILKYYVIIAENEAKIEENKKLGEAVERISKFLKAADAAENQ